MAGSVVVREATLHDVDRIVEVHLRARTAYYSAGGLGIDDLMTPAAQQELRAGWIESVNSPDKRVLCAQSGGALVGLAAMGPPLRADVDAAAVGQLYQIHVAPGSWGMGFGSLLHAAFLNYLRETRRSVGLLEVWEHNIRAREFYARFGWRPDGRDRPGPTNSRYIYLRLEVDTGTSPPVRPDSL